MKKRCTDGNEFFLYHSFGQSAGYGNLPRKEMLELVRKNGLMSHSAIGRRKDLEDGAIIALTRERIWFSRMVGCEFTRFSDPLLLRVHFDEDVFDDDFVTLHDDDQFFGNNRCEVFIEKSAPFTIPPSDIDYWNGSEWTSILENTKSWKRPSRTIEERMQPSIREDFNRLRLSPRNEDHVKAYVYIQPDDKMTREEFFDLAEKESETIDRWVLFDYDVD